MYIYLYVCMCVCIHIYIYIHIIGIGLKTNQESVLALLVKQNINNSKLQALFHRYSSYDDT